MKRNRSIALTMFAALSLTAAALAAEFLSLPDLIERALANNPSVAASAQSVEAAKARITQSDSLPDPMLTLGAMSLPVDTYKLDQEPMTQLTVGVAQKLPFPGKLHDSGQAADYSSKAASAQDLTVQQATVYMVRAAYYDIVFFDRAIEITDRNQELLDSLAKAAQARYSVGMGIQQDVIKAQVEISKILDDRIGYEQNRAKTAAELNRLINAEPGSPVASTQPDDSRPPLPDRETVLAAARNNNPAVLASKARVDQARSQEAMAKLSPYPDVTVMAQYGFRQDGEMNGMTQKRPDLVSASVSIPIPVWKDRKQDQEIAEKEAVLKQSQLASTDVETRVAAQVEQTMAEAVRLDKQIKLLETGIIPQATASLESAQAGYQTGKVDFITLLNNEVTLFQMEIRLARLQSDYMKTLAALDQLSGKPVDEILKGVSQ